MQSAKCRGDSRIARICFWRETMKQKLKSSKKLKIFALCLLCIIIGFLGYNIIQNQHFEVNEITIKCETLPDDFQGYKIVQVSDLHNTEFGENNSDLLSAIKEQSPDIIVVTGDIVDSRRTDVQIARDFVNNASEIAPVYYVTGNHEARVKVEDEIDNVELNKNVIVLHNKDILLEKGESVIQLIGVDDPDYKAVKDSTEYMNKRLEKYCNNEYFKILLSHRPELFEVYAENNMNVILKKLYTILLMQFKFHLKKTSIIIIAQVHILKWVIYKTLKNIII